MPWQFQGTGQAVGALMAGANLISALVLSPTDNRMTYWRLNSSEGVIALNQIGGTLATQQVILLDEVASLNYDRHLAWLPDGSGLVISVNEEIFDYIIATSQVRQLTSFNGSAQVDRVTVSPDGNTIAFSFSPNGSPNVSDIWLLNRQTFQITALTTDGRSTFPSWSRVDPPSILSVFLPMVIR
ncbi:MAG: PD40 domain-containing protein [Anaerolineales bacterium]|nr:PD40 domain-containing protein [Anaerolineales bacterium]